MSIFGHGLRLQQMSLQHTCCNTLQQTPTDCNSLLRCAKYTATPYCAAPATDVAATHTLQQTATDCNSLLRCAKHTVPLCCVAPATRCNTMQHNVAEIHCKTLPKHSVTLQHTATHTSSLACSSWTDVGSCALCIRIYVYMYIYTCTHVYIYVYIYIYIYIYIYTCINVYVHVHIYICVYRYMCLCVCV